MKIVGRDKLKIILLLLILGLAFWLFVSIIEYVFDVYKDLSLSELIITNVPISEIFIRVSALVFIILTVLIYLILFKSVVKKNQSKHVKKYMNLFDYLIIHINSDYNISIMNYKCSNVLNLNEKNIGQNVFKIENIPDNLKSLLKKDIEESKNKKIFISKFRTIEIPNGKIIKTKSLVERDEKFRIKKIMIIGEDITKQTKIHEKLEINENRMKQTVMNAPLPVLLHDDNKVVLVNNKWCEITGYEKKDFIYTNDCIEKLIPYANKEEVKKTLTDALKTTGNKAVSKETVIVTKNKKERNWIFTTSFLENSFNGNELYITIAMDITKQKEKEEEIENLAKFPSENPNPILRISKKDYKVMYTNKAGNMLIDYWKMNSLEKEVPEECRTLLDEAYEDNEIKQVERTLDNGITLFVNITPVKEFGYVNIYGQDITDLKKTKEELRFIAKVFENSNEGIVITDLKGNILKANKAFLRITGYSKEEVIGQNPRIIKSDKHGKEFYSKLWSSIKNKGKWENEIWNRRKNGEIYPAWLSITTIKNNQNEVTNYIGMSIDISQVKETEEQVRQLINFDPLTNIPNRTLLRDRLQQALIKADYDDQIHMVAILCIDIDNFKLINETLGHRSGDKLLTEVAARLNKSIGKGDTVARLSADEFIIVLTKLIRTITAATTAKNIIDDLSKPFVIDNKEIFITISIGISVYPFDGQDIDSIMKSGDTAMHYVKKRGKNNYQFYSQSMNKAAFDRLELETSLRKALDKGEFLLNYQPKLNLKTGKITGMEALIRWSHPVLGMVSPVKFIPLAEEIGLIVEIGDWVLEQACKDTQMLIEKGLPPVSVSVNLSGKQFKQKRIIRSINEKLEISGLDPKYLDLEITETAIMGSAKYMVTKLYEIKDMGISLSIDDFGTGYSSLSYLKYFPIDTLKIDRSFIKDCITDMDNAEISKVIITLSHSLGLNVVAEGVETKEQLNFLKKYQCDQIQGYLISKPVSIHEIEKLIQTDFSLMG